MNSHPNLQTLFSNVIQAIVTKIALEYNLSVSEITNKIGFPTITDDLELSIQSYCNSLITPVHVESIPEKPKKIIKKKVLSAEPLVPTIAETNDSVVPENNVAPEKPKRVLKKKAPVVTNNAEAPIASVIAETQIASPIVGETIVSMVTEAILLPVKPKKILKKKAPVTETIATLPSTETISSPVTETNFVSSTETITTPVADTSVICDKPKKVLKKKVATKEVVEETTPVISENSVLADKPMPQVKDIVEPEVEELKLKPKKIILKKPAPESKKNVDEPEYGEDVEQAEIYESLQTYEEDSLEPREINGVKYYVDTSGYIYDFENQDLVGKLNQSGDRMIVLNDFSPMNE